MNSTQIIALFLFIAGAGMFALPQSVPRRFVKSWTDGYAFAFWVLKMVGLIAMVIGAAGVFLGK
jgi:hypothetical protein